MKKHVQTKTKKSKKPAHVDAPIPFRPTEPPDARVLEAITKGMGVQRPEVALSMFIAQTMRLITAADEGGTILETGYLLSVEFLTDALTDMIEHQTVPKAVA